MVGSQNLEFNHDMLKTMLELYTDLVQMFVGDQEEIQLNRAQEASSTQKLLTSRLSEQMKIGLNNLPNEYRTEIEPQFRTACQLIDKRRQMYSIPIQQPGV